MTVFHVATTVLKVMFLVFISCYVFTMLGKAYVDYCDLIGNTDDEC